MFRRSMAAIWLLSVWLSGHAQAATGVTNPSVVRAPIEYPASAVSAREQGTVLVRAEVDTSGRAVNATIDKSSGYAALDAAALQSISQWRFSPGTRNGQSESRWVVVPISFQLTAASGGELASHQYSLVVASALARFLGALIWIVGFGWSVVLAKRKSILWLSGMVALWVFTYPLFVAMHWSVARRSLILVVLGIALIGVSFYLLPPRELPI